MPGESEELPSTKPSPGRPAMIRKGESMNPRTLVPGLVLAMVFPAASPARAAEGVQEIVGRPPIHGSEPRGRILMVAANPAVSKQTGLRIGCWAAELTHPYQEFTEAGYQIVIASPQGGPVEFDAYSDPRHESGYSASDLVTLGFVHTPTLMERLASTAKLSEIDPSGFDAIFLVGGQSPMYTFRGNAELMKFFADFYKTGKPAAAVGHATAILLDTKTSNGELLVKGRTWTGSADAEEHFADFAMKRKVQPFWIEQEARKIPDTNFVVKGPFTPYAVRDGNLVTGQQQHSGAAAAGLVLGALERRRAEGKR